MRLVVLGFILVSFAVLDLAFLAAGRSSSPNPAVGLSGAFSGVTMMIFISKIARPRIYGDWLLNGAFCSVVGLLFNADEMSARTSLLVVGCLFLAASLLVRTWIGLTASPPQAAQWVFVSGCSAAAGLTWIGLALNFHWPMMPRLILALDALLQGACIIGFGASLRRRC